MTWIEDIDYLCPWLMNNLRAASERVNDLKECQAVRMLRQMKKFILNHPVFSLFLAIVVSLVFLPLLLFLTFVSSSFVVVSVSALTVLGGTFVVALFSFLVALSPALVFGGIQAKLIYLLFCFVMKMLQIIKRLKYKCLAASRRLRHLRRCRREPVQFVGSQVGPACFAAEYEHSFIPALNEE
ncbi:uncharacterized protein LOC110048957 [Orbicella faveolata]|uniref:uncharacterized protein LOC110048957 n=1 Tax=Orbicella faveolata TaxID=48498 RepID=UPI0009E2A812|nr:uncharacterized protein LOC110048957 [Orbicella faveolata]